MTKKQLEDRVKELESKVLTQEKTRKIWGSGRREGYKEGTKVAWTTMRDMNYGEGFSREKDEHKLRNLFITLGINSKCEYDSEESQQEFRFIEYQFKELEKVYGECWHHDSIYLHDEKSIWGMKAFLDMVEDLEKKVSNIQYCFSKEVLIYIINSKLDGSYTFDEFKQLGFMHSI